MGQIVTTDVVVAVHALATESTTRFGNVVLWSPGPEIVAEGVVLDHVEHDLGQMPTLQAVTEAHALLDNVEREKLRQALVQTHNNRLHAAKLLGISRSTLYEKLKRYHLLDELSAFDPQLPTCARKVS